jgi:hypothetical protein
MTVIEELTQIVPTLPAEDQRRVLDLANRLRDERRLPDVTMPSGGAGEAEWEAWRERLAARGEIVLEREKRRLQALGLIDEDWNELSADLPVDMLPSSKTSVET